MGICLVAAQVFPNCQEVEENGLITLKLRADSQAKVEYPKRIQEIADSWPVNHKALDEIKVKLYLYKYDQFGCDKLQKKIIKIVENSTKLPIQPQATSKQKSVNKESIDLKAGSLFKGSIKAETAASKKEIYLFIGETGSGKSTTMNYLHKCKMERIFDKNIGVNKPVIIAHHPLSKMGLKGVSSTTSDCFVVTDPETGMTYVDCQGYKDTRGPSFEIYNALSLHQVINSASKVKGFLVFLEYSAIDSSNGAGVESTLLSLFKQIKDFKRHERSLMFVITKQSNPDVTCDCVKDMLIEKIKEIVSTYEGEAFGLFCQQILDSQILEGNLGERLVISDPLKPSARETIIREMKKFSSYEKKDFGYAVSEKVLNAFQETRQSFVVHAQNVLSDTMKQFREHWEKEIAACDVSDTKQWLHDLTDWNSSLAFPTLKHFAEQKPYTDCAMSLNIELQKCLKYWEMMDELNHSNHTFDELVKTALTNASTEMNRICKETETIYYNRMFAEIKHDLESCLHSYEGRKQVAAMHKIEGIKNIEKCDPLQLFQVIQGLFIFHEKTFPHSDQFETIMQVDAAKSATLKTLVKDCLLMPINSKVLPWGPHDKFIQVTTNTQTVALSEIMKEITPSLDGAKNISIQVKSPNSKLYLDQNMLYDRKILTIQADQIIVEEPLQIKLAKGSLVLRGEFIGGYDASNEVITFSKIDGQSTQHKKPFSWNWQ